ncbi:uncharacterized protein LOC103953156 isoform X2 [Pyrus x bretschneideri]|uniref:uncharacterized protein LOC103953156 isoform X2 n=1 Tax=Pyrus x bretschneideri TaxID=225117 RepID=UPI002030E235|nr:uncharacterized protein LOC103953156 isoform X2 [Pyrus x bretschneideri]
MNGFREENSFCYFHPKELVVGVCSLCLTERLLILSAKKGRHHHRHHVSSVRGGRGGSAAVAIKTQMACTRRHPFASPRSLLSALSSIGSGNLTTAQIKRLPPAKKVSTFSCGLIHINQV